MIGFKVNGGTFMSDDKGNVTCTGVIKDQLENATDANGDKIEIQEGVTDNEEQVSE